jgi:hypothetical protein
VIASNGDGWDILLGVVLDPFRISAQMINVSAKFWGLVR